MPLFSNNNAENIHENNSNQTNFSKNYFIKLGRARVVLVPQEVHLVRKKLWKICACFFPSVFFSCCWVFTLSNLHISPPFLTTSVSISSARHCPRHLRRPSGLRCLLCGGVPPVGREGAQQPHPDHCFLRRQRERTGLCPPWGGADRLLAAQIAARKHSHHLIAELLAASEVRHFCCCCRRFWSRERKMTSK